MLRNEVAAFRQEAENAKENLRLQREEHISINKVEKDTPPALDQQQEQLQPPPLSPPAVIEDTRPSPKVEEAVVADDSATWRRRYEHLAGLLTEQAKELSGKVREDEAVVDRWIDRRAPDCVSVIELAFAEP